MAGRFRSKRDEGADLDAALARGEVLRFTGAVFESAATPGKGLTFSAAGVLRRWRVGKAMLTRTGAREPYEIEVRAAPRRTSEALGESLT